ncbi:MAG: hypothetical protein Q4E57_03850 [Eubacteriales bacterium]|nr:hypothetical protein [Eubacteriales bacterium]
MEAFHSFWSEPNRGRNNGVIRFPDYEQLTSVLSALKWQQFNGRVRMITDTLGAENFKMLGIDKFWNKIDVTLDELEGNIDPFLFWAAGKLYALKSMPVPCAMIDTDLVIWKNVDKYIAGSDIAAAHSEDLRENVYPDKSIFKLKPGYSFPAEWDFTLKAANTAFLYIKNSDFRDYYVDSAIEFFKNVEVDGLNPVTAMCFAEQRVLPMCAASKGQSLRFLLELPFADAEGQDVATHIWGFKQVLEQLPEARYQFCMRCVRRIAMDFPDKAPLLSECRDLKGYYEDYLKSDIK